MPVGIQRLNARRTQPNSNIVFIKPLPGPDSATAEKFLERIAAQCLPIMKEHHLSVVTLEEYEPNREFVGRNFNAGEVIQLVLKSARAPHRWLPFRYVQMVMMHELAHCVQMNHSRAFWAVRNAYAASMTDLWAKGYTGEGIWGRGAALGTGAWEDNTVAEGEPLPEYLCGGTYRSRRRGRKRKPKLSWKEQKERRIAKKFGTNGTALGADETVKVKLERGKKVAGKPRVAGSARGRELRAAAALARFDTTAKTEGVSGKDGEEETASDSDDYEEVEGVDAVDVDGTTMKDGEGHVLVKVCADEHGEEDPAARTERDELRRVFARPPLAVKNEGGQPPRVKGEPDSGSSSSAAFGELPQAAAAAAGTRRRSLYDIPDIRDAVPPTTAVPKPTAPARPTPSTAPRPAAAPRSSSANRTRPAITIHRLPAAPPKQQQQQQQPAEAAPPTDSGSGPSSCPLCSLGNDAAALRCAACAHVLRPDAVQGAWRCGAAACRATGYVNAGDCGVCGLCGGRKP